MLTAEPAIEPSPPTRLQSFLSTKGPITFILPSSEPAHLPKNFLSVGIRLAHDLHIYHRLDADIVYDNEIITPAHVKWPRHNFVVMGRLDNPLVQRILGENKTPLGLRGGRLTLNGRLFETDSDAGSLTARHG